MNREIIDGYKRALAVIVTKQLSAVVFVMDYIQLVFVASRLTCYNWPTIRNETGEFPPRSQGSRDALCSLLESSVTELELTEEWLLVKFSNGSQIELSLIPTEESGVEAGMFWDCAQGVMIVWN